MGSSRGQNPRRAAGAGELAPVPPVPGRRLSLNALGRQRMDFSVVNLDEDAAAMLKRVQQVLNEALGDDEDWPVRERESGPTTLHQLLGGEGLIAPRCPVDEGGVGAGALGDRLLSG